MDSTVTDAEQLELFPELRLLSREQLLANVRLVRAQLRGVPRNWWVHADRPFVPTRRPQAA